MRKLLLKLAALRTGFHLLQRFPLLHKLRKLYVWLITRQQYVYIDDFKLDIRGRNLNYFQNPEPESFDLAKKNVVEGMVAWDIGACVGAYSILFSRLVGDTGTVYAFEPETENFKKLITNLALNQCLNVRAVNVAIGDKTEPRKLMLHKHMDGMHSLVLEENTEGSQWVQQIKIDDELFKTPDFIKLDVEGGEVAALQGMEALLTGKRHMRLLIEFDPAMQKTAVGDQSVLLDWLRQRQFILVGEYDKVNFYFVKYIHRIQ